MALGVGFRTSFGDRNRNCEKTQDMSFGSNGADWVRSIRKNQPQFFSLHKWPEWPSGSGFARVLVTETETGKHTRHEFWVKQGGLGASDSKKSTAIFSPHKWPERPSGSEFRTCFGDR